MYIFSFLVKEMIWRFREFPGFFCLLKYLFFPEPLVSNQGTLVTTSTTLLAMNTVKAQAAAVWPLILAVVLGILLVVLVLFVMYKTNTLNKISCFKHKIVEEEERKESLRKESLKMSNSSAEIVELPKDP